MRIILFEDISTVTDVVFDFAAATQEFGLYVLWSVMGVTIVRAAVILSINRRDTRSNGLGILPCSTSIYLEPD